ncbi:hypothetical protein [Halorussus salinus]|uniref:hypothetical protein n=1 Tax=Halorussus salinus TaxID=1364935 RepID=UPI0010920A5C|nr:hypothetical protein [Halorussus salinus]
MKTGGKDVSQVFRDIADLLEAVETRNTNLAVTTATPAKENLLNTESISVEMGVKVPFVDEEFDKADLTPTAVEIQSDGCLHVEMEASVPQENSTRTETAVQTEMEGESAAGSEKTAIVDGDDEHPAESTEKQDLQAVSCQNGNQPDDLEEDTGNSDTEKVTAETETTDLPPYQDPDRLQAVYDEHETFKEMTDALDVEVSAQTVRRYMIKYGIHEPASNTGSRPAETLLHLDPDNLPTKRDPRIPNDNNSDESPPLQKS